VTRGAHLAAAAVLAFGGLADAAVLVGCASDSRSTGGPLGYPGESQSVDLSLGVAADRDVAISTGILNVENRGSTPLTLDRASVTEIESGLKVLGVYAVRIPARHLIGTERGFTPEAGRPLRGLVLRPEEKAEIVIGVASKGDGSHAFRGVRIDYSVGSQTFERHFDVSLRLCAPARRYAQNACKPANESQPPPRSTAANP
jgi:hypothetical protein